MAYSSTISLPKTKGGAFLIEERTPRRDLHARGLHRRAPRHRAHGRRVLDQGSRAESRGDPASGARRRRARAAQSRRNWDSPAISIPEKFGGMEMDLTSAMVVAERLSSDGSYSGWHGAHTGIGTLPMLLFGTEEQKAEVSAEAGHGRNDGGLLPQRAARRFRCAGRAHPRRPERRRHALRPQRPEDVDHQRRRGRSVHRLRQGRRREVHRVSGGARVRRRQPAARKKRRWGSRAAPPRPSTSTTSRCRWRTCWARSAAATSSRSTS